MWFVYSQILSLGIAIGGLGLMLTFWALNKYYKKRNKRYMENKFTKEYFSQFKKGDTVYFYNAQLGVYEKAEVIDEGGDSGFYYLSGDHPRANRHTLHQLIYASLDDLIEHQMRVIKNIKTSRGRGGWE